MSVYMDLLHAVDCGRKFKINLVEKTLKIDRNEILLTDDLIERDDIIGLGIDARTPWDVLEELYAKYKRSAPSAHYNGNKPYFKADKVEDLTDDEIAFNEPRDWCQAALEGYVLFAGLSGWLEFENKKHWFWQGTDRELVVLREWI